MNNTCHHHVIKGNFGQFERMRECKDGWVLEMSYIKNDNLEWWQQLRTYNYDEALEAYLDVIDMIMHTKNLRNGK